MTLIRLLTVAVRVLRDVNAIRRGRIVQRVQNRVIGKVVGRVTRRLWR